MAIFLLIEALLLLWFGYQLVTTPPAIIGLIIGIGLLVWNSKRKKDRPIMLIVGIVMISISVMINPAIWIMLAIAVLFIGVGGAMGDPHNNLARAMPWMHKQFYTVNTVEPMEKGGTRTRRPWFGDFTIGQAPFEWDDINLCVAAGDTIIDLGNTLLPERDNVVVVRKGFGKTRILVPIGVGVSINHSALYGQLHFNQTELTVHNETITQYSEGYADAPRRIRLVTSTLIGDVEVLTI